MFGALFHRSNWVSQSLNNGREERCGSPPEHWTVSDGVEIENSAVGLGLVEEGLWLMGFLVVDELVVIIFVDSPVRDFSFIFFLVVSAFFSFYRKILWILYYYFDWG